MANDNAFEKLHIEDKDKTDLAGLLEALNLPPGVVKYARRNQKTIYFVSFFIVIAVVTWSLYGSYHEKKINQSGSALSIAKKEPVLVRPDALHKVLSDYPGTKAALWANVELAHEDMRNNQYAAAAEKYSSVRKEIKEKDPLYPLLTFGIAQAMEMEKQYPEAITEYTTIKNFIGYEGVGYLGKARVFEMQDEIDQALLVYEEYMATFSGEDLNSPDRLFVQEKITGLKAIQ